MVYNNSRMAVFYSSSEADTVNFGREYAKSLKPGDVILLSGGLGAGKTHLVKGIALGLGIRDEVVSPTYAYMNEYGGKLFHFDFYRISSSAQAEMLGLTEYFGKDNICVAEWAENIADVLPEKCRRIRIFITDNDKRRIEYE